MTRLQGKMKLFLRKNYKLNTIVKDGKRDCKHEIET